MNSSKVLSGCTRCSSGQRKNTDAYVATCFRRDHRATGLHPGSVGPRRTITTAGNHPRAQWSRRGHRCVSVEYQHPRPRTCPPVKVASVAQSRPQQHWDHGRWSRSSAASGRSPVAESYQDPVLLLN